MIHCAVFGRPTLDGDRPAGRLNFTRPGPGRTTQPPASSPESLPGEAYRRGDVMHVGGRIEKVMMPRAEDVCSHRGRETDDPGP